MAGLLKFLIPLTFVPGVVWAQMDELSPLEDDTPDTAAKPGQPASATPAAAPMILEEFEIDERDLVLSAARSRTTIQEAPGIITVLTAQQMREAGYRTVNDALQAVPGFEGGRIDSNGWFRESFARGQARTVLILINGVNTTEPLRNALTLDRKIPMEIIKRIEITSGPGGVLWGANALLGVVNIILKDSSDLEGFEISLGGGGGPGAQGAGQVHAAYGGELFDGALRLFTSTDFYTDRGSRLEVDAIKVLGVLPSPELDGKTLYKNERGITDFNSRDWWVSNTLNLTLYDTLTLEWHLQFEKDYRQIATGGALLRGDTLSNAATGATRAVTEQTVGDDSIKMLSLAWRDRFLEDRFGLNAKIYGVDFTEDNDPFWAFPPRYLGEIKALEDGVGLSLRVEQMQRLGGNLDGDLQLGRHQLLFGAEAFRERIRNARRGDTLRRNIVLPELADSRSADPLVQRGIFGPNRCPPAGAQTVRVRDLDVRPTFDGACGFDETLVLDTDRTVGALYLSDNWQIADRVALRPGFRVQASDTYDPVALFAGAFVWNISHRTYLKLNYAEGFRPPSLQSTRVNDYSISSVNFKSDPNLKVERSRALEAELNAVIFEDYGLMERLYLRADYAYSVISDLVRNVGGRFTNAGERGIHSVEFLARADWQGGHETWFGGHFVQSEDSESGPVRNVPNWVLRGGALARLADRHLELSTSASWVGPQEDLNRAANVGTPFLGLNAVDAVGVVVDRIDSYMLLTLGARLVHLWDDRLELSVFVYNALNTQRFDPDFFFDDRVISRPQPQPGWSAFSKAVVRF